MISVENITATPQIQRVTESVLRDLPEWFGQESALLEYVKNSSKHPFYLAVVDEQPAGFLSLDRNNGITAEIYVMGVYRKFHGTGIGKTLVAAVLKDLALEGFSYLLVKTVGESLDNEAYAKTRRFYQSVGFKSIQEIPEIWGAENPCLLMIQNV